MPGMWYELERIFAQDGVQIGLLVVTSVCNPVLIPHNLDIESSFFVGDAAGRRNDHAGTDRKWALNIGIPFFTPEVCDI